MKVDEICTLGVENIFQAFISKCDFVWMRKKNTILLKRAIHLYIRWQKKQRFQGNEVFSITNTKLYSNSNKKSLKQSVSMKFKMRFSLNAQTCILFTRNFILYQFHQNTDHFSSKIFKFPNLHNNSDIHTPCFKRNHHIFGLI